VKIDNFFAELKRQNDFNDTSVKKAPNESVQGLDPGEITLLGTRLVD
jgi:hypothetical protein